MSATVWEQEFFRRRAAGEQAAEGALEAEYARHGRDHLLRL